MRQPENLYASFGLKQEALPMFNQHSLYVALTPAIAILFHANPLA